MPDRISIPPFPEDSGVYEIRNTVTGDAYVGSSRALRARLQGHASRLAAGTHDCPVLQASYSEHGAGAFAVEILWRGWDCRAAERDFIAERNPSFNRQLRGTGTKACMVTDADLLAAVAEVGARRGDRTVSKTFCDLLREQLVFLQMKGDPKAILTA